MRRTFGLGAGGGDEGYPDIKGSGADVEKIKKRFEERWLFLQEEGAWHRTLVGKRKEQP